MGGLHNKGNHPKDGVTLDVNGKVMSIYRQEAFLTLAGRLDKATQQNVGHQLPTMLLSCMWRGHRCTARSVDTLLAFL